MQEGSTVEKKDEIRDLMTPSGLNTTATTPLSAEVVFWVKFFKENPYDCPTSLTIQYKNN